MENSNYEKTTYMKGLKFVFSQIGPYFTLFLFLVLKALLTGIFANIPMVGAILSALINIIFFMFTPFCVVYIVLGVKLEFSCFGDYFKELKKLKNKTFIFKAIFLFLMVLLFIGILTISVFLIYIISFPNLIFALGIPNLSIISDIMSSLTPEQIIGLACLLMLAFLYFTLSANFKMLCYGISCLYEDYEFKFIKNNFDQYKYAFLWTLVPIIGLFAGFVLPTMIATDMKKYFGL